MADHGQAGGTSSLTGIPLQNYSERTPPGWTPYDVHYPFRKYIQLLRLWFRVTTATEESLGPLMAGRLKGAAFQIALN